MTHRFTNILANFKAIHESIEQEEQRTQPRDGMDWVIREGTRTNCRSNMYATAHGVGGPCNCGFSDPHALALVDSLGWDAAYRVYLENRQ
jgi:adenine deaminase